MSYAIVNKERYQADPELWLNTLGENDWFVDLNDAVDEARSCGDATLLVLFQDSNGEISEEATLLSRDGIIDLLNELGQTGHAEVRAKLNGGCELWLRSEENADWRYAGVVLDRVSAQETIESYYELHRGNGYAIYPECIVVATLDEALRKASAISAADPDGFEVRVEDCDTEKVVARFQGGQQI